MRYLIDGHNLIAKLPDISLSDPDDEARLVDKLKRWAAASRRRQVTVIFDRGLPAGVDHGLSGGGIQVIFASGHTTADALLIRRIDAVSNPPEYTVVSSDREVAGAAARRRIIVLRSEVFAVKLADDLATRTSPASRATDEGPQLSPSEVDEWLSIFGRDEDT